MRWIPYLNVVLVVILICVSALFCFHTAEDQQIPSFLPRIEQVDLPKSPFAESEDHDLSVGPLALKWVPPLMQLPDLKQELQYFGQNGRPDVAQGQGAFHLGLKSSGECRSIRANERVYLVYQGNFGNTVVDRTPYREPITTTHRPIWGDTVPNPNKGSYVFSPDNQPTPLWLETAASSDQAISLRVNMLDEKGGLIKSPPELRQITLQAQEFPKSQTVGWELGGYRVDSTLLVRQKARWIGADRFLELHGGEDFSFVQGRERIDFFDQETPYSCYIGPHDYLVWKGDRWVNPKPGEATEGLPLLCVRKVDEKILSLELWDGLGRSKTVLSLIRAKDHQKTPDLAHEFKFVGAKTWAQFIVECRGGGRMTLKPHDWLVLTQEGWKKLDTPEQVDAYVEGTLMGPLFILDKMTKQNGRQVLVGHLFNTSRTEVEEVELEASSNTSLANFYRAIPLAPPIKPLIEGHEE